jgi:uncharacterized protein
MVTEVNAVTFRQNLGEMLNQVQYRKDSIVINKDGKPVAALVDAELFARIRRMRERFDELSSRIAEAYADVPQEQGMAEIDASGIRSPSRPMSGPRVVLDTNVIVSGIAYPTSIPGRIVGGWKQGSISVILARYILDEAVLSLPRILRGRLSPDEIRELVDSLAFIAEVVEPAPVIEAALRDRADLPILGTLLAAQADYLITGDKDLLALAETLSYRYACGILGAARWLDQFRTYNI